MRRGPHNHILGVIGRVHVLFILLGAAHLGVLSASAQSVNEPYTLRERAATNRLELFRTSSEMQKTHGLMLDDKHRVKLYEDAGWIVISLQRRQRAPGGPYEYFNPDDKTHDTATRYDEEYDLMRIGSEVLAAAPPNYIRNPGRRYRVTIEGLAVAPLYKTTFEVDASNALDAVATEFHKISAIGHDIEVPAIEFGGLLAMRALNESGYLPARIPLTILRSKVGQIRIQGQYFERGGKLLRLPRFGNVMSGPINNTDVAQTNNPLRQEPQKVHGPGYKRGSLVSEVEPIPVRFRPYRPEKSLVPKDTRANMFAEMGADGQARERFVAHVKPLTAPDRLNESALNRANRGTLELLTGAEMINPLEAKAASLDGESASRTGVPSRRSGIARAGARH